MELLAVSERCKQHYPKIQYYEIPTEPAPAAPVALRTNLNANTLGGGLS